VRPGYAAVVALAVTLGLSSCDEAPAQQPAPVQQPVATQRVVPTSAPPPAAFVGGWTRHSTQFDINDDGTGKVLERAYTPCGTSRDCAFHASLTVAGGSPSSVSIIYDRVWFTGEDNSVMTLSALDHQALDPYFPRAGQRATATVDAQGRLVLTYAAPFRQASRRPPDADTYCGRSTDPGRTGPCGA